MSVALYLLGILAAAFVISGALPRYLGARRRLERVREFERQYRLWTEARARDYEDASYHYGAPPAGEESTSLRAWLVARRNQMQRDAEAVAKGIIYVAAPPMIGGGPYRPHSYFSDLFDQQSFTDHSYQFRLDELATIVHETERQRDLWKRALWNPWSWLRTSFERIVAFPRYVLRLAGFSAAVTDSRGARVGTAVWSFVVGVAGIGSFVVGLLTFLKR